MLFSISLHYLIITFFCAMDVNRDFRISFIWGQLICASHSVMHGLWPIRLLCPWDFPDENTGVVAIFFSRGSSWPRDWTCVAGRFFTIWATREAPICASGLGTQVHSYGKSTVITLASVMQSEILPHFGWVFKKVNINQI